MKVEIYTIITWAALMVLAGISSRFLGGRPESYVIGMILYYEIKKRYERIADKNKNP